MLYLCRAFTFSGYCASFLILRASRSNLPSGAIFFHLLVRASGFSQIYHGGHFINLFLIFLSRSYTSGIYLEIPGFQIKRPDFKSFNLTLFLPG